MGVGESNAYPEMRAWIFLSPCQAERQADCQALRYAQQLYNGDKYGDILDERLILRSILNDFASKSLIVVVVLEKFGYILGLADSGFFHYPRGRLLPPGPWPKYHLKSIPRGWRVSSGIKGRV